MLLDSYGYKRHLLSFIFISISSYCTYAQSEKWMEYTDKKTGLIGYKDVHQIIRVPAKFSGLTHARKFEDIIEVMEEVREDSFATYYLLKSGEKIGIDSAYIWDMSFDCEQEGKIRFRDEVTDKVGFFDKKGKVIIPAVYSDARPFYNGLAVVIKNAKRMCENGKEFSEENRCEHWFWKGGEMFTINEKNEKVFGFTSYDEISNLDWYSISISNKKEVGSDSISFLVEDGKYYSFLNKEEGFKSWFYKIFLNTVMSGSGPEILKHIFPEVMVEANFKDEVWKRFGKGDYFNRYKKVLVEKMNHIKSDSQKVVVFVEGLNPFIFNGNNYESFYNNCGDPDEERFPVFNVVISYYKDKNFDYQDSFQFLKTAKGYQLIAMGLKN